MKQKKFYFFLSIIFLGFVLAFASCKDSDNENNENQYNPEKPDYTPQVTTSVYGFITDENDKPLQGANVTAGEKSVQSDEFGFFEIKDSKLTKNIGFVTADKSGYFKGVRTWVAEEGQGQVVHIKLLPKLVAGSFTNKDGGAITTTKGVKLTFPADAVVTKDGQPYTGEVKVALQWLDAVSNDFERTMPGDLRAVNTDGNMVGLISYGMAGVELTSGSGQLLKMADGKKVQTRVPIASALLANAPANMPLWSFDEAKGLWIEEGVAKKEGNEYVGEVSHFSWWNWDYPNLCVYVSCKLLDSKGNAVPNARVEFKSEGNGLGWATSDNNGKVKRLVPKNASVTMTVSSQSGCTLYTESFTTASANIDLGNKSISDSKDAKISGIVNNCDGTPLAKGKIIITENWFNYTADIVNGKYNMNIPGLICETGGNKTIKIVCKDYVDFKQAELSVKITNSEDNQLDPISMCGSEDMDNISVEFDGKNFNFSDYIYFNGYSPYYSMGGNEKSQDGNSSYDIRMSWNSDTIKVGTFELDSLSSYFSYQTYTKKIPNISVFKGKITITRAELIGEEEIFLQGSASGQARLSEYVGGTLEMGQWKPIYITFKYKKERFRRPMRR